METALKTLLIAVPLFAFGFTVGRAQERPRAAPAASCRSTAAPQALPPEAARPAPKRGDGRALRVRFTDIRCSRHGGADGRPLLPS